MKSLLSYCISAGVGLWLAVLFVPGVMVRLYPTSNVFGFGLTASWQLFILLAFVIGLLNYFIKPILNIITLPLRIITLGLFGFLINMGLVWVVDYLFKEFSAPWLYPLFFTTLIIWGLNMIISKFFLAEK